MKFHIFYLLKTVLTKANDDQVDRIVQVIYLVTLNKKTASFNKRNHSIAKKDNVILSKPIINHCFSQGSCNINTMS